MDGGSRVLRALTRTLLVLVVLALLAVLGVSFDYFALLGPAAGGVAYGAHVGGFVGGLFLTSFVVRRPDAAQPR